MKTSLPVIAVPARLASSDATDPRVAGANEIFFNIIDLIRTAGLEPRIVEHPGADLTGVAGVVLPGGGDVDPQRYGGKPSPELYDVNPEQDELDFSIASRALAKGLPLYGICRGAQVINVIYGGSVLENLGPTNVVHTPPEVPGDVPDDFVTHDVIVEPGTLLAETLDHRDTVTIQSAHHQAINQLGTGLTATAAAADRVIEAFEDKERWVVAVQWHPEVEEGPGPVRDGQFNALAREVRRRQRHLETATCEER